jgi:hypothetical protein
VSDISISGALGTDITVISLTQAPISVLTIPQAPVTVVTAGQGLQGAPGPGGFVSRDPGNTLSLGTDDGLYAPDLTADPLAHYLLAKA